MKRMTIIAVLSVLLAGCAAPRGTSHNLERGGELWTEYNALDKKEQHTFMRDLTTEDLFAFTLAAIPAAAHQQFKGKKVDFSDPNAEEVLGMFGGDDFEDWGEKRLADGRRLTAATIINLLNNTDLPPEWRSSFRGYLRVIFYANPGRPPSDAYEIGLTDEDITKLKRYLKKTSKGDPQQMH